MASLEIVDVQLAEHAPDHLYRRNIDFPKARQEVDGHALRVVGWVLGKEYPAIAVEISVAGHVISRSPVDVRRPDIATAFPDMADADCSGYRAFASVTHADPYLDLHVRAVLVSQERVALATIRVRNARPRPHTVPGSRVSIIVPCYNQAHFLGDALASVAAQTESAFEVVVIDDGSTDNTAEVAARYPGVQCVRQDNAGLAAARNTGLQHVTGDYLVFLDADDRLMPSALEVGLKALLPRAEPAFVFGGWRLIGADGSELPTPKQSLEDDNYYRALLRMCFVSTPAAVMYRRSAVEAAGGFDTRVSPSADYDLYLRLTRTQQAYCHGDVVAEYRRHGSNMTLNRGMMLESELAVLRRQRKYIKHQPDLIAAYRQGLRRARDYHGGRLARDVRALAATGKWSLALEGGLRLLRHNPAALMWVKRAPWAR